MDLSSCNGSKGRRVALSAAALAVLALSAGSALAISQSGEQKTMELVGHVGLQFRGAYQPNVIRYPDGRTIAFVGLHRGQNLPGPLPNPPNGSKDATWGLPLWRQSQSMVIVDWSNPNAPPHYIRTHGLPGGQPRGTGPTPTSLHGAISAYEHPNAVGKIASGVDVIGNRVYAAWGVGSNGVLQILDRKKLLPAAYGGTFTGDPDNPTDDQLLSAQVGRMDMSPDQGGHTSMPVFGLAPKSLQCSSSACPGTPSPDVRDIVLLSSEAGNCNSKHWSFVVDVTTENSIGVKQDAWQGPMVLSTLWVNPQSGEKYPRGNYCLRGQRFGTHSTEENFRNPYYGRLAFTSYFNAGVREWDNRDPQGAVEAGFYVPAAPKNTYMTNNVEVDNRGYIIIVDRIGNGMDILKLTGKARNIGLGKHGDDDDDDGDDD